MPQLVALFNGFGGAASVLVAGAELIRCATSPASDCRAGRHAGLRRHRQP